MAKDDFDIDFDFEKEYGFDPNAILDSDVSDEDLDLSQFGDEELGMDLSDKSGDGEEFDDFDLDSLDLGEDDDLSGLDLPDDLGQSGAEEPEPEEREQSGGTDELDFDGDLFPDEDLDEEPAGDDLLDFSRRASFFDVPEPDIGADVEKMTREQQAPEEPADEVPVEMPREPEEPEEPEQETGSDEEGRRRAPNPRRRKQTKDKGTAKLTMPPVFSKLWSLYFPPKEVIDPKPDPANPRRRRKSKAQIFKEAYLPAILACVTLILMVSFLFGAIGNLIAKRQANNDAKKASVAAASSEADRIEEEVQMLLREAERLAAGYDYDGAVQMLDSFSGELSNYQELVSKRAEYINAKSGLVEWKDPNSIPNLSFHVLIADPVRAFSDEQYKGSYNRNFVTIEEFSRILEQIYKNGYVLVDFDSFVATATDLSGEKAFSPKPIYLPEGKKPIMITETMVNYFNFMTDSNDDGEPDAGGGGFASKLVVDAGGSIKAEYVDSSGSVLTGNYDLVPILEDFIAEHPDFVYQGARATLAVCGYDGVFGYRINTSVISTKGNDYYQEQVAGAQKIVEALRAKGYTIACYTFDNIDYGQKNAQQITDDLKNWTNQIELVIGDVDVLVYAREGDIGNYNDTKFNVLYDSGFRFFVSSAEKNYAEVNNTYVRQKRLMVTGNTMVWKSSMFDGIFDCNAAIDLTARGGSVPNG